MPFAKSRRFDRLLLGLLLGLSSGVASAQVYRLTEIPPLTGGHGSWAYGVNAHGEVVGVSDLNGSGEKRGFLWRNGTLTNLGVTSCGDFSWAHAINRAGLIAMTLVDCSTPKVGWRPFLHDGTQLFALPYGETRTVNRDIDSAGSLVGSMDFGQTIGGRPVTRAFFWDGGVAHDLGTLGGDFSQALGLNDIGQAVGGAQTRDNAA